MGFQFPMLTSGTQRNHGYKTRSATRYVVLPMNFQISASRKSVRFSRPKNWITMTLKQHLIGEAAVTIRKTPITMGSTTQKSIILLSPIDLGIGHDRGFLECSHFYRAGVGKQQMINITVYSRHISTLNASPWFNGTKYTTSFVCNIKTFTCKTF